MRHLRRTVRLILSLDWLICPWCDTWLPCRGKTGYATSGTTGLRLPWRCRACGRNVDRHRFGHLKHPPQVPPLP